LEKKMTLSEAKQAIGQTVTLHGGPGISRPAEVLRVTEFDEMAEVRIWFDSQQRWAKKSSWVRVSALTL
jgi:hypothetical protein